MMRIGYIRVSTEEQHTDRQETIMQKYEVEKVFSEKISGKNTDRPQLKEMLSFIRTGDTLVIESYSRLARSTADLIKLVEQLNSKGVNLISDKEHIDTTTPQGKLMFTIFAGLAEFERTCLLERQREGIAEAKKQGKYKGRQSIKVDNEQFQEVYNRWKNNEITARKAMADLNLKPDTFYRRVKAYEQANTKTKTE
ncbi:MAG: recombinase family protein [Clostridia bacterium]|nr:recombinase family protein [Clostridia bacterium]